MRRTWMITVAVPFALLLAGCPWEPPLEDQLESLQLDRALRPLLNKAGAAAISKPSTDAAKVTLGRALMFDKILSGNRDVSCATCHHPAAFTGDSLSLSKGVGGIGLGPSRQTPLDQNGDPILIPRNAPDVFNRAGFHTMFWDGRVQQNADGTFKTPAGAKLPPGLDNALAAQAMFPVTSREEMRGMAGDNEIADLADDDHRGIWGALMARLLAIDEYRELFAAAYPGVAASDLTFAHAANAIAAFEIERWTFTDSPFDEYLQGSVTALPVDAKRGALLFYGTAGCAKCHSGALLTDQDFHNVAVPQLGPGKGHGSDGVSDFGREGVTNDPADRFRFRTPPLRNAAFTGPWMHDGAYATLEAAARHMLDPIAGCRNYDTEQLGDEFGDVFRADHSDAIMAAAGTAGEVESISLSEQELADLMAFLYALSSPSLGESLMHDVPERVPSGLPLAD